ncbi:hypothetical protein IAT38_007667 [Cryptococcus sp. DSM 104549]
MSERAPILPSSTSDTAPARPRGFILTTILIPVLLLAGCIFVWVAGEKVPTDDLELAKYYLKSSPVIDGHVDVPELARTLYGNNVSAFDLRKSMPGHFDIPRVREGHLGALFWSIYVDCLEEQSGRDFLNPTFQVRDTLEQIDVTTNIIEKYSDTFALARTADEVETAIKQGKVGSLMGLEGGHGLGNSLAVLRMYHQLGVRYMTLTHSCNNAFADSAGYKDISDIEERWGGLSPFGHELIHEMNRVGIFVDLSHVSDKTALQALAITRSPVIFSHSSARHFNNWVRNVPDEILGKIGRGKHQVDAVVMVNFFPVFVSPNPDKVNVASIADEVEYIAKKTSRHHVGIGSDYDGVVSTPHGLEDVSKYPYLFAELIRRGWTQNDLSLLAGGNLLRVMRGMEDASRKLRQKSGPSMAIYGKRHDLDPKPWPRT